MKPIALALMGGKILLCRGLAQKIWKDSRKQLLKNQLISTHLFFDCSLYFGKTNMPLRSEKKVSGNL